MCRTTSTWWHLTSAVLIGPNWSSELVHLEIAFSALLGTSQFTKAGQQAFRGVGGYIFNLSVFPVKNA